LSPCLGSYLGQKGLAIAMRALERVPLK
jgi:hypothetical protein